MKLEFETLMCDICKERPMVDTKKIKGEWKGVCNECITLTTKENSQNERKEN